MKLISILLVTIFIGCGPRIFDKSRMHLAKKSFDLNNVSFEIDGYYFTQIIYKQGENYSLDVEYGTGDKCGLMVMIFYSDGFIKKSDFVYGTCLCNSEESKKMAVLNAKEEVQKSMLNKSFNVNDVKKIWDWGMYEQDGNDLLIQYYYNHYGNYNLINYRGKVIDGSTLILNEKSGDKRPYKKVKSENDGEKYLFQRFWIKPDSTNYIRENLNEFG